MQVVIVDDEPAARGRLARLCTERNDLHVVAEAATGAEAIQAIKTHQPDLLLLDIELRDMTGFDVLAAVKDNAPVTIIVTAHREYAVQAFEVEARDFLTKPVDECRFEAAIGRARQRYPHVLAADWCERMTSAVRLAIDQQTRRPASPTQLLLEKAQRLHFIDTASVECMESEGNYVIAHTDAERYLARNSLKQLAVTLAPLGFLRIERSLLINLRRVAFVERLDNCYAFTLRSGRRLVSGITYRKKIRREIRNAQLSSKHFRHVHSHNTLSR
jgi:two-component system LytT family response regulator